jgi:hypothetical protein
MADSSEQTRLVAAIGFDSSGPTPESRNRVRREKVMAHSGGKRVCVATVLCWRIVVSFIVHLFVQTRQLHHLREDVVQRSPVALAKLVQRPKIRLRSSCQIAKWPRGNSDQLGWGAHWDSIA